MGVYTQTDQGNWLSRRGIFVIMLVAFHLLLFWALKSGFAVKLVEAITQPIVADIINEERPTEPPPPPPEVQMEMPPVSVPPLVLDIQLPPPPTPPFTVTVDPPQPQTAPPVIARPPTQAGPPGPVVTRAQLLSRPDMNDIYPSTSRNLGEEGRVRIRMCIGTNGRVTEASISETSGYSRLDDAALRSTRQYRFRPGTEDGKPVAQCFVQPVAFSLRGE